MSRPPSSGRSSVRRPRRTWVAPPTEFSACSSRCREITDGFATDQLTHCLQTATLAERAGADDEVVVAALCHDIGKAVSVPNHPRIAAEILRPYVRDEVYKMILVHQDFQGRHYYQHFGGDPEPRETHRDELTRRRVRARRALCRRVGPDRVRSRLRHASLCPISRTRSARSSATPRASNVEISRRLGTGRRRRASGVRLSTDRSVA